QAPGRGGRRGGAAESDLRQGREAPDHGGRPNEHPVPAGYAGGRRSDPEGRAAGGRGRGKRQAHPDRIGAAGWARRRPAPVRGGGVLAREGEAPGEGTPTVAGAGEEARERSGRAAEREVPGQDGPGPREGPAALPAAEEISFGRLRHRDGDARNRSS